MKNTTSLFYASALAGLALLSGCKDKTPPPSALPTPPAVNNAVPKDGQSGAASVPTFVHDEYGNVVPAAGTRPVRRQLPEGIPAGVSESLAPAEVGGQDIPAEGLKQLRVQVGKIQGQLASAIQKQQDLQAAAQAKQQALWAEHAAARKAVIGSAQAAYDAQMKAYSKQKAEYDAKTKGMSPEQIAQAGLQAPQEPSLDVPPETAPPVAAAPGYDPQSVRQVDELTFQFRRQAGNGQRDEALATFTKITALADQLPPQILAGLQDELKLAFPLASGGKSSTTGDPSQIPAGSGAQPPR